ncbi:hypothetical protein Poly59_46490 [Rubripirellula reticaptiva]|uniref:Uncharacterized protein n=2 Tax=Rubripirellula reticaptiva TaxID=2528013 RepID=A0A5C6EIA6_9BACT|nr:hypothetical protein Poly59_46490 [Rubripirellula reticaptiva]
MLRYWSGLRACETCGNTLGVKWPLRSRITLIVMYFIGVPLVLWASAGPASVIALSLVVTAVGLLAMLALLFRDGHLVVCRRFMPVSEAETLRLRRDYHETTHRQQMTQ